MGPKERFRTGRNVAVHEDCRGKPAAGEIEPFERAAVPLLRHARDVPQQYRVSARLPGARFAFHLMRRRARAKSSRFRHAKRESIAPCLSIRVDSPEIPLHPCAMHPSRIPPSTLTQAAASNRPRVGDYLQAPDPSGHRIYIVLSADGYRVHAASAARGAGLVTIDTTWPRLASAGFRLRRYDGMQQGHLRMIVILATLILMSVLTFVLAAPLSFTQVVSMSIALLIGHVAVTVPNGYKRDYCLGETRGREIARADQSLCADDFELRVRDVRLRVELVLVVYAALDLAGAQRFEDRRDTVQERVGTLGRFDAAVEDLECPRTHRLEQGLARAMGRLCAHQEPDLVERLPLAVERQQRADLEVARGDVERLRDCRTTLRGGGDRSSRRRCCRR
jgi:hypothetical protein